jgi:tetratricopeptide (TPR) repeat protein
MREINSRELDLYRRKADRYPTEMAHRFELGVRLLRAGQVDEAIRELQAARSDPRQHYRSLLYLAYCFKTRNNWRLAKRNFEECLQQLPPSDTATRKEVLFQLAQGSAEAGELSAAIELAHELANLDFAFKDIGRLLDEWQARLEQADV